MFPFILLCTPFGKVRGGNMMYYIFKFWAGSWYILVGIWHKDIYEEKENTDSRYVFVANHISYIDIPPIFLAIHQPVRVLGKYEMVHYPVFGWIYRIAVILVDRRDAERRAKSFRALKAALSKNISIFIFPEGTFNMSDAPLKGFYDGAFRLAIQMQTPIKPLVFVDTIKRLHHKSLFSLTPGRNRVVHLPAVDVSNYTLKDVEKLKREVYEIMEKAILKYR